MSVLARELASRYGVGLAAALLEEPAVVPVLPGSVLPESVADEAVPVDPARSLPVRADLAAVLPGGALRRGSVLELDGSLVLTLALLAQASAAGTWCAVVGLPSLGVLAAAELGVDVGRLALVPDPGPDWPSVTAALVDTVDLVVLRPPEPTTASVRSRLGARLRERGGVLLVPGRWPGADLQLRRAGARWEGVGHGHGRLTGYALDVEGTGRGSASRPRRAVLQVGVLPELVVRASVLADAATATAA